MQHELRYWKNSTYSVCIEIKNLWETIAELASDHELSYTNSEASLLLWYELFFSRFITCSKNEPCTTQTILPSWQRCVDFFSQHCKPRMVPTKFPEFFDRKISWDLSMTKLPNVKWVLAPVKKIVQIFFLKYLRGLLTKEVFRTCNVLPFSFGKRPKVHAK